MSVAIDVTDATDPTKQSWFAHTIERIEAALGVMLAGVVAGICAIVTVVLAGAIFNAPHDFQPLWQPILLAIGLAIVTVLSGLMLRTLGKAFEANVPHPTYRMAGAFAHSTLVVRVGLGFAALIMAAAVLAMGHFWSLLFDWPNPSTAGRIVQLMLTFLVMLGASYASNGYFLCFLRAMRAPDRIVNFVFHWRYLIDAAIAGGLTII